MSLGSSVSIVTRQLRNSGLIHSRVHTGFETHPMSTVSRLGMSGAIPLLCFRGLDRDSFRLMEEIGQITSIVDCPVMNRLAVPIRLASCVVVEGKWCRAAC